MAMPISVLHILLITVHREPVPCPHTAAPAYRTRPKRAKRPPARTGVPRAATLAPAAEEVVAADPPAELVGEGEEPDVSAGDPEEADAEAPLPPPVLASSVVRLPQVSNASVHWRSC